MHTQLSKAARSSLARTGAAVAIAMALAPAVNALPLDLSAFGLVANDDPYLTFDPVTVSADAASAAADGMLGSVLFAATGVAPYGNGAFSFTLSDLSDPTAYLNADSVARGYSSVTNMGDALFSISDAGGLYSGISSSLYIEMDISQGVVNDFSASGLANFTTTLRIYETEAVGGTDPGVIPLPAAGLLFSTVLAGFGLMARRRR